MLGGPIDLMCDQTTNTTEQINSGAIKVFAVTTPARLASLPERADLGRGRAAGLRGQRLARPLCAEGHAGGGDAAAAQALQVALRDATLEPRFAELGTAPVAADRATPEPHRTFWQADIAKWRPIIQAAGQYAD